MEELDQTNQRKQKVTDILKVPEELCIEWNKENIIISSKRQNHISKEEIINQAFKFHAQGNISEAAKYYQYFINQGFLDHRVFCNYGMLLKDVGKLQDAEVSTRKAIKLKPNFVEAYCNLGIILKNLDRLKEAEQSIQKAIELKPDLAEAHANLGNILIDLRNLKEAEVSIRKAIELKPDLAEPHCNLGNILKDLGNPKEAEVSIRKAIQLKPNFAKAHYNLGLILKDLGDLKEAEVSIRKAIKLKSDFQEAYSNLGLILQDLGNLKEAEVSTRKAIRLKPNYAMAHSNLGSILSDLGNLKEAELSHRKAIELQPDLAIAHSNLGSTLKDLGNLKEAEISTRKAIKLQTDLGIAHSNLGLILSDLGDLKEAELFHRKAIELQPIFAEPHNNLSSILLRRMELIEGWQEYEWRWEVKQKYAFIGTKLATSKPEWLDNNRGRVLLWPEQGIGDKILFASLIPELVKKVDQLIIKIDRRLIPLFKRSFDPSITYLDEHDVISEDKYDSQIAMGSVPKLFRNTIESFETHNQPYLKVDEKKSNILREQLRDLNYEKIIGISWRSKSKINEERSLSLEELVLGIYSPRCCFVNLQYGDTKDEIINLKEKYNINIIEVEDIDNYNDIDGIAALINACDHIVSIENFIPNLAGAIGCNSFILLNHKSHWRYGEENDSCAWYPALKLFRSKKDETWDQALNQIQKKLMSKN